MSLEHHAVLGFLQAIHYSARVAKVNSKCCRSLSRAVGTIRPVLEELDMAVADGEAKPNFGEWQGPPLGLRTAAKDKKTLAHQEIKGKN